MRSSSSAGLDPAGLAVGLRPPQNPHRSHVNVFVREGSTLSSSAKSSQDEAGSEGLVTLSRLYEFYAQQFQLKPNSKILSVLTAASSSSSLSGSTVQPVQFPGVKSLNFTMCMFRDRGMLPVLELLRHLPQLETLVLASNDLTNDGVEWLAHALALTVTGTEQQQDDQLLQCCPVLAEIDMSNNKIGIGGTRLLSDLSRRKSSLTAVKLDGVKIDASERRRLDRFLAANKAKLSQVPTPPAVVS